MTASDLQARWNGEWDEALELWSRFTKLAPPVLCATKADEQREGLSGSFAMIRLTDHRVVVGLEQVDAKGLGAFAREILAHEVGHHVYAPANLRDNARLAARIRVGLPTREYYTGLVANLYTDLLINDRLQRFHGLDMAGVYRALPVEKPGHLWTLYMRMYEMLWSLPSGTLTADEVTPAMQGDADLGARLVRAYARDWLDGAGRFACLVLPYLLNMPENEVAVALPEWLDTLQAGAGDEIPDGLAGMDDSEVTGAIHPAEDPDLTGLNADAPGRAERPKPGAGAAVRGGHKQRYRDPDKYVDLLKALGVDLPEQDLVARYYRERALPHLIPFPAREVREALDPLPESLDVWDVGSPLTDVDWVETVVRSPRVIPGVTTLQRVYGTSEGGQPERVPVDLYLGVDCSGSMSNPRYALSYPVLAGTIITLSALRAGAKVMTCLSGETPGRYSQTDGFIRRERDILHVLTGYLGTGYSFGIGRLHETFVQGEPPKRPTHILIVSDSDWFYMLKNVTGGWDIARRAAEVAGGGATACLELPARVHYAADIAGLRDCGWDVHLVPDMASVVAFARAFSKLKYDSSERTVAR